MNTSEKSHATGLSAAGRDKDLQQLVRFLEAVLTVRQADRSEDLIWKRQMEFQLRELEEQVHRNPVAVSFSRSEGASPVDRPVTSQFREGLSELDQAARVAAGTKDTGDRLDAVMDFKATVKRLRNAAGGERERHARQLFVVLESAVSRTYAEDMTQEELDALVAAVEVGLKSNLGAEAVVAAERILRKVGRGVIPPFHQRVSAPDR